MTISQTKKTTAMNECTSFAGHFGGHDDVPMQFWVHPPIQQIYGYPGCHWTPPLGEYSPCIAPADAMVIDFGSKNQVAVLVQKVQKGFTQLIKSTSWIERLNAMIKAEELRYLFIYQTLTVDKKCWSYQSPMKLMKKWTLMSDHSC
jgi:hypothetical protein